MGAGLTVLVLLLVAGVTTASEPTPTPTPTPTPRGEVATDTGERGEPAERTDTAPTPTRTPLVISNENLAELAAGGSLTEVTTGRGQGGARPAVSAEAAAAAERSGSAGAGEDDSKRSYWRGRYQDQKRVVEAIRGELARIDQEIPGLWSQYYAWDDPAYRDGVIKVRLDEALAKREDLARRLPEEEARLPEILNQARRDGALPGWFRDLK